MTRPLAFFDIEVFPNYFLVAFEREDGKRFSAEMTDTRDLSEHAVSIIKQILMTHVLVGYNCLMYDCRILTYVLYAQTHLVPEVRCQRIHAISKRMIEDMRTIDIMRTYQIHPSMRYIDLMPIAPSPIRIGLKLYGARMHTTDLRNLPYDPHTPLTPDMMTEVKAYCYTDIGVTKELYEKTKERVDVRITLSRLYGMDVMNKSDAQIAEAIVKKECVVWKEPVRPKSVRYRPPSYIVFQNHEKLRELLHSASSQDILCNDEGKVIAPAAFRQIISIGNAKYKVGIGGLHSCEKKQAFVSTRTMQLIDIDVASYYPSIILNQKLFPRTLGEKFLKVYQLLTDRRLAAKKVKDKGTNEGLKIVINGSFGKFASRYSVMFDPELLLHVTMTGQLSLFMLIEKLENHGIQVVSANTDGLIVAVPHSRRSWYDKIIVSWQKHTGFVLEAKNYRAVYSRDVSNYFAIAEDGSIKGRGIFNTDRPLQTNPSLQICIDACFNALKPKRMQSIETTINRCQDLRKFLLVRQVTGGAMWREDRLGKVVRWIWVRDGQPLLYVKNGNKVPQSDSSMPVMRLDPKALDVVDRPRYITEAYKILESIGGQS